MSNIKAISTTFDAVSRFDFITSVMANMSRMIAAIIQSEGISGQSPFVCLGRLAHSYSPEMLNIKSLLCGRVGVLASCAEPRP
jgi:hypothetical protein